jgi:hypothetical protein
MKTYFDCIPCFMTQALNAVRMASDDEAVHERVLRQVVTHIGNMDMRQTPPAMGRIIHQVVREAIGSPDPFYDYKKKWNKFALRLMPELRKRVAESNEPFGAAVRLAIAGNIIDFAANSKVNERNIWETIEMAQSLPLNDATLRRLEKEIARANKILYLADNAGEIVFDRLLIEQMPMVKITVAVKGGPVSNDATMEDAVEAGITELVNTISNGADAPGCILDVCSPGFIREFEESDVVIAKGQANFETLNAGGHNIFFIFMAKCSVIAREAQCAQGSLALIHNSSR